MLEGFCGLSGDRFQKIWENSWTQKNQKSTRLYFKISVKKTILNPATLEYQLNDSLFSSFNETLLLRWWMLYIKIAEWRNKSTQDHDSYKYAIYAVEKRKSALPFKAHRYFSQLIFDSFVAVSLYFLANKRGSSALIWTAQISIIIYTSPLF